MNASSRDRMQWQAPYLAAFAVNLQMLNTAALLNVAHLQQHRFFTARLVIEKHSQYRPIALPLLFHPARRAALSPTYLAEHLH